jgi:TetR/AcrR family transcriptional repressor of nem operon
MRASREQVLENKRTILEAAGRLFRERGFESVTVADVMKSAGLTHGGFYGYFKNKNDLIAQTLAELLGETEPLSANLATLAEQYLMPEHRDNCARGCPVAALASETIRQAGGARTEMTAGLERQIKRLSQVAPGADEVHRRRAAIGSWAAMVGALIMARTSDDSALSDEILSETLAWLTARTGKAQGSSRNNRASWTDRA